MGFIDQAKKSYAKKAEDNRLRGWIREGDVAASVLEKLANLIPDMYGLSVLKGALAFLFQVSQSTSKRFYAGG